MSKSIEDKYKVLDQISHILLRPQTYLGSNKPNTSVKYIYNNESNKMEQREITYIPSFLKIFDEVITNSIDESKRNTKLNRIDVTIDKETGRITVLDNGGIPIVIHKEHKQYIPEVVFGTLLSGSNYSDDEERIVAGVNGYGSKLSNIFSTEFKVSSADGKKTFLQTFSENMRKRTKATTKKSTKKFTEISFIPDYEKFGLSGIDEDHYKMIEKRVYDLCGCNNKIKIYFDKKLINFKTFKNYTELYTEECFYESTKDSAWSVGVAHSINGFQQVSFANSTETYDGGTHVDYITNQIITQLREFFKKKHKTDIKPSELKQHLFLFINSTVVNPSFSSQTKEKLITEVKEFGFKFEVSDKIIKSILKSEIVESILDWIERKQIADENKLQRELNKKLSKVKVEKLIDAKGKDRWKSSLAIFEGDCLHEDTKIRIIRDGDIFDTKIKDVNIDDVVITHNNTLSNVYSLTKKIKKKSIIKTKDGEVVSSKEHKWFVYDVSKNEFYFEKTINLDKSKHKLVKNYLAFTESLLIIERSDGNTVELGSGEIIDTNYDHMFAIYDRSENKFKMCKSIDIDPTKHLLVNSYKL